MDIFGLPIPVGYEIPFFATLIVIGVKFSIAAFLGRRVYKQSKTQTKRRLTFIGAAFLLILCLGISRSIYFYYDFFLTQFIPANLFIKPNIYYWQVATCIAGYSGAFLLFVLERDIYRFKTCLIPTGAVIVISTIQLLYPVNNMDDFQFVSTIGIIGTLGMLLAIITFIYLAIKSSGLLRKVCVALMIGVFIYAIAGMAMSENILGAIDAAIPGARAVVILLVPIFKIVAFTIITWGAVNFQL
nr:hypothetical protein [Candidatus Sigynarchaeota archaeon]